MINLQVKSFKKSKKYIYLVLIDDVWYSFYDDVILDCGFLVKKNISLEELNKALDLNKKKDAYFEAIKYLSVKKRCESQVFKRLNDKGFDDNLILAVIDVLKKEKYLDDYDFAKCYVHDAIELSLSGPKKILKELSLLGLDLDVSSSLLEDYDFQKRCDVLCFKRLKSYHKGSKNEILNKLKRYLVSQGYEMDCINNSLQNISISVSKDSVKSDYMKIRKRLLKKYDGDKLDFEVMVRMQRKGYTIDDVRQIM